MASVSNISLSIPKRTQANTRNVTVSGTLSFHTNDVGKSYRLEIKIFGEDKPGDELPVDDLVGNNDLYTFLWGTLFNKKPYKQYTVAAAGSQTFTWTRSLSEETLDEDSGNVLMDVVNNDIPIFLPRQDEVYAKVSLLRTPAIVPSGGAPELAITGRSATEFPNKGL